MTQPLREQISVLSLALLLEEQQAQLSQVFEILGTPPKEALQSVLPQLLGGIFPLNLSESGKHRELFPIIFEYLHSVLSDPKIVKDCLKQDIDLVVTEMVLRVSDLSEGRYSKYAR